MDVQVDKTGPCEARIRFNATAEEVALQYQSGIATASRQVRMKGFRPGKVPAHVIEKHAGKSIGDDTVRHFFDSALRQAMERESLRPATGPQIEGPLEFQKGEPLAREFVVELKPDFELQDYAGLAIETLPVTTTDQEVEDTIRDVLRQQARPEPAGDEGLTENGLALARLSFHHTGEDGTSREVVARDGLRISPATPPIGVDPEQFRSAVTGAVEGAERELPLTFPDGFETAELRGQAGVCKVQLTQVFKLVPPEESELYRQFGVDDGPALRTRVREQLLAHKQRQEEQRLEAELFDRVIDSHPMPVPQRMLANQVAAREARAVQDLIEQQGLSKEAAQAQVESEADSTRSASEKSLRALFLVEAIGDAERLQVTREDLSAELRQIAARNRTAVDEVVKYYQQHNLVQQLTVELLERKVRAALRSKAAITPKA